MAAARRPGTTGRSRRADLLAGAADLAIAVARADAADDLAPEPPAVLRPLLALRRGTASAPARDAALAALEDDGFRARVAAAAAEVELDAASRAFVDRAAGWEATVEALERSAAHADATAEIARLQGELATERAAAGERDAALDALRRHVADLERRAEATDRALAEERARAVELVERAARLADDRQAAVRDLKRVERRLADRTREIRALRAPAPVEAGEAASASGALAAEHARLLAALDVWRAEGRGALATLAASLDAVAAHLGLGAGAEVTAPTGRVRMEGPEDRSTSPRRRPVRMGRGLTADTADGLRWLLGRPGVQVLVDGYNVTKSAWPVLELADQRDRLVAACTTVAAVSGASIAIVFDGEGGGGRPARSTGSAVRVVFAPGASEADDEILALLDAVPPGDAVVVVSSDRRVASGARAAGANAVGSAALVELLRRDA